MNSGEALADYFKRINETVARTRVK